VAFLTGCRKTAIPRARFSPAADIADVRLEKRAKAEKALARAAPAGTRGLGSLSQWTRTGTWVSMT
jgi:hypothetical protein